MREIWLFSPNTGTTTMKIYIALLAPHLPSVLEASHHVGGYDLILFLIRFVN